MNGKFLFDGPGDAPVTILLAHGAGAPMDSTSMTAAAMALAGVGFRVAASSSAIWQPGALPTAQAPAPRGNAQSGVSGGHCRARRPRHPRDRRQVHGRSRRQHGRRRPSCRGQDRRAPLPRLSLPSPRKTGPVAHPTSYRSQTPALICQGTRDEFGTRDEVSRYALSDRIELLWLEDGDHDLKPRKTVSGFSTADHLKTLAEAVARWADRLAP